MTQLLMIYTTQHREVLTDTKIWWSWSYGYVPSSQLCLGTGIFLIYASKNFIAPHIPGALWRPRGLILQFLSATEQNFSATVGDAFCYCGGYSLLLACIFETSEYRNISECLERHGAHGMVLWSPLWRLELQKFISQESAQGEHKCPLHPSARKAARSHGIRHQLLPTPGTRAEAGLEWSHSCWSPASHAVPTWNHCHRIIIEI